MPAVLAENTALDLGERTALALALELHIRTVLLDEKAARRVATELGLRSVGVLGILLEAKTESCSIKSSRCWTRCKMRPIFTLVTPFAQIS